MLIIFWTAQKYLFNYSILVVVIKLIDLPYEVPREVIGEAFLKYVLVYINKDPHLLYSLLCFAFYFTLLSPLWYLYGPWKAAHNTGLGKENQWSN